MPRVWGLLILSTITLIGVGLLMWFGLGHKTWRGTIQNRPWLTPTYLAKREILVSLYHEAQRTGSLPPSGMETIGVGDRLGLGCKSKGFNRFVPCP